ncbi:uncharacterized protein PV09_03540 [Verruconis gallopava]|uniref:Short-chain dehydrogenase/reductase 3 n=1 Tax=Verruconis gallopava TaxID=253628 RepID=A0A0D1YY99_9PEZI|nr:uncharacterized protein PV09_03540 [Verruconis gallopava]KIW05677.1 hypothetical protein PV09_03540 [Verruconis gallopava]
MAIIRSDWSMPREGFTFDTVLSILKHTAFDPRKTLPVYLAALYTTKGQQFFAQHPKALTWLRRAVFGGLFFRVKRFLDQGVANNWRSDRYDWNREIVVVTGGSDGIGAKMVQMLASKGIKVVVLDIQEPKYVLPPKVQYFHCDLGSPDAIRETAAQVKQKVGHPTVLINNAGFARGKTILDTTDNDLRLTFQVNAICHYQLAQQFLPEMIKNNHGMVVTIASLASYVTAPSLVDYCASKSAALTFHEGLQTELYNLYKADKVRCVCVNQGYTKTALFAGFDKGDGFVSYALEPDTVAEATVKAVLAGKSDHIILPVGNTGITTIKAWPTWMQVSVRKGLNNLMKEWKGRQVAQPSEAKESNLGESIVDVKKE